jgi:hypothetical protein
MKNNENETQPLFALQEEVLARELSLGLEDMINLKYYQSITKKYPERILRDIYNHVRQIPQSQIKKSKGALFNYLLQKHGQNDHRN